jgi:hypothetical protein
MSLLAWQTALAELITARASGDTVQVQSDQGLSQHERTWFDAVSTTTGFELTCAVQRWWREFRIQQAAPLTLGALDTEWRALLMAEYTRRHGRPSSFFLREALPFLDLACELASDVPHLSALAAFERAMLRLGDALTDHPDLSRIGELLPDSSPDSSVEVEAHPLAEVVCFQAPVGQVLAAAARGLPFPPVENRAYWILIAPGLANLASASSAAEARLFQAIRADGARRTEFQPDAMAALQRLWAAGALRRSS